MTATASMEQFYLCTKFHIKFVTIIIIVSSAELKWPNAVGQSSSIEHRILFVYKFFVSCVNRLTWLLIHSFLVCVWRMSWILWHEWKKMTEKWKMLCVTKYLWRHENGMRLNLSYKSEEFVWNSKTTQQSYIFYNNINNNNNNEKDTLIACTFCFINKHLMHKMHF